MLPWKDTDTKHTHIYAICAVLNLLSPVWLFETPWTVAHQALPSMDILQAKILERVAMPSSRWFSQPRDRTQVFWIAGIFFTAWATREAQEYWGGQPILSPGVSSRPRNQNVVSWVAGRFFTSWATKKAHICYLEWPNFRSKDTHTHTHLQTSENKTQWFKIYGM